MGIDLDPLDDIFAAGAMKNARMAGKFQPKSKFRPPRNDSAATSCSSSRAVQVNGTVEVESRDPVRTAKSSEHNKQWNSGSLSFLYEKVDTDGIAKATVSLHSGVVLPSDNGDWHLEKAVGENADIFVGLESLGDFLPPTSTIMDGAVPPPETIAVTAPNSDNAEGGLAIPVLASVGSRQTSLAVDAPSCSLASGEPIVSGSSGVGRVDNRELETVEMDVMDARNVSESVTGSEKRSGKFHPKPKMQVQNEMCEASIKTVSSLICSQQVLPEISYTYKDSFPAFEQEDVLDLSSIELAHTIPSEATSDLPVNDDSVNLMETNKSGINLEGVPEMPAKLASRRAKTRIKKAPTTSDPTQPPERGFTFIRENEAATFLRSQTSKRNLCELVDESEDEVLASREFPDECAGSSAVEEDNINNEEYQVESESQMKAKRRAKKPVGDKAKMARKRKESPEHDTDAKPKKFSHSTWRRKVDKALLETPEDDIDYQKVPLRDLILLAEHKERQTKKEAEAAAAGAPLTKQSNEDSSECCNEDESFTSKQGIEHNNGQEIPRVEEGTVYFNYQTYMDRAPSTRWSKQDTELFYEAVQQFGTDLSLIQQLFPGRTRRQVKLKYKKEERQHPLRLREALTNRAKDHSHFETVIGRLQKIAAEENENADGDGSTELRGNDLAEVEEAKNEQIEEQENEEDAGQESAEVGNPLKSYDSEDDMLKWSQYRSDV